MWGLALIRGFWGDLEKRGGGSKIIQGGCEFRILDFSLLDLLILHSKIFTIYASKYLCMNNCMNISIWSITNIMMKLLINY